MIPYALNSAGPVSTRDEREGHGVAPSSCTFSGGSLTCEARRCCWSGALDLGLLGSCCLKCSREHRRGSFFYASGTEEEA